MAQTQIYLGKAQIGVNEEATSGTFVAPEVGDQFLFNAEGYMLAHKCPEKICPFIMPVMTRMMWLVMERTYEGLDPRPTFYFGDCDDVGVECGGLGQVGLETTIVDDAV